MELQWIHLSIFVFGTIPIFLIFSSLTSDDIQTEKSLLRKHALKQTQSMKVFPTPRQSNQTIQLSSLPVPLSSVIIMIDSNTISGRTSISKSSSISNRNSVSKRDSIFNKSSISQSRSITNRNSNSKRGSISNRNSISKRGSISNRNSISKRESITNGNGMFNSSIISNTIGISNGTSISRSFSSDSLTSPIYQIEPVDVNTHICPNVGQDLKLLIAVTSATNHGNARLAIRETWGHWALRKGVAVAFMVGATFNKKVIDEIRQEQDSFGDIVIENFNDTYDNLTNKTIKMLEWVSIFCSKALFVLKTDDDVFINVDRLLTFVDKHKPSQRAIYGRVARQWRADRWNKSKYYISPKQYEPRYYPDFTTGPAYLFPARLSEELYLASLKHKLFKFEDVYVTGIIANCLKIKRVHVPEFLNIRIPFTSCNVKRSISIHNVRSFEQYDLWKKQHDVVKCRQ